MFLRYSCAYKSILGDEKKSKWAILAQRASILVQGGAKGFTEDGLGADGLSCKQLGRPGAPVIVLEY